MAKKKMKIDDLPGNSNAMKVAPIREEVNKTVKENRVVIAERKAVKVKPRGAIKKKGFIESIASTFVGSEPRNVGLYILEDVLLPAMKSLIQDIVTNGVEMLLFGEKRSSGKPRNTGNAVSYNRYFKGSERKEGRLRTTRERFELDDIFFRHGPEANDVLEVLTDMAEQYGEVSVADYYEAAGVEGTNWVHHKYGWDSQIALKRAYVTHTVDGYKIVLPEPVALD